MAKDNPVPSIDDRIVEALMILDNGMYNGLSPEDINKVKKVLNDIPNGVETK